MDYATHSSVLVVGAGPVGLVAAVALRQQGVAVRIVDAQAAEGKRTYPVLLHPRTVRILGTLGVTAPLEWRGRAIERLAVYTDGQRRATLALPAAGELAPGAMTLPQDVLRQALMRRLRELGTDVEWQTGLVHLEQDDARVRVGLVRRERIEGVSSEPLPAWHAVASQTVDAAFVVAADGTQSAVRRALGIGWRQQGPRRIYAFYDAPDRHAGSEAHLVVHETFGNSVYPLQRDVSRFTFEVAVSTGHPPGLAELRHLLSSRMPWYEADAQRFEWSGTAEFNPALVDHFGEGRVWLAGDAAHSTGPLGGQSLNVGIHEASDLARRIVASWGPTVSPSLGIGYGQQRRLEWQRLFGLGSSKPELAQSQEWVRKHLSTLLPALPAAGDDLDELLEQLGVRTA
jgi:2-polyprenyl-6-methoxyphenol hydroxylase-like FAD-dependent oxidoreductase